MSTARQLFSMAARSSPLNHSHRKCPIGHALDIPFENWTSSLGIYKSVDSRLPGHLRPPTCCLPGCLTAIPTRFVSRNPAFPRAVPSGTPCDQGFLSAVARHDISSEKMSSAVRLYKERGVGSEPPWRTPDLPAGGMQNSRRNGESGFPVFVADPRSRRRRRAVRQVPVRRGGGVGAETVLPDRHLRHEDPEETSDAPAMSP